MTFALARGSLRLLEFIPRQTSNFQKFNKKHKVGITWRKSLGDHQSRVQPLRAMYQT